MTLQKLKYAFNLKENFKDIFIRQSGRFDAIDGLRAFSVLYVLLFHAVAAVVMNTPSSMAAALDATNIFTQWVMMGDRGVDSFFVISGFLIAQILFKEHERTNRINLKRFFFRRWLRLTPVYFLLLLLFYKFATDNVEPSYLWAYVFYVNNFLDEAHRYIPYGWSLAVEEQFYIVFSLLCAFLLFRVKHRFILLLFLYFLSYVIRALILVGQPELLVTGDKLLFGDIELTAAYNQALYINLHSRFGAVMTGVLLAYAYVFHYEKLKNWLTLGRSNLLLCVAVALLVISSILPVYHEKEASEWVLYLYHIAHRHIFSLAIVIFVYVSLFPKGLGRLSVTFFSSKFLYPISQLSYSIYLFHLVVLVLLGVILKGQGVITEFTFGNVFLLAAGSIPIVFIICSLLFVLVERPFMKLR